MTIFELVKLALDELYQEGVEKHKEQIDQKIRTQMAYLANAYKQLDSNDRNPINYRDPATRFAYVYKYVAAHGDYLVQVLEALRSELSENIFENDTLNLSCVGGGPGSDVIGILKYLEENNQEPVKKITCYLLDGEQAWADTWTEIAESLSQEIGVNLNFQKLDVTDPESWSAQRRFLKADIFTLSYFVSEVYSLDNGVIGKFWKKLFDSAKVGAIFLYVDNGSKVFNEYFDKYWEYENSISCIFKEDNFDITPRTTEQWAGLKDYRDKFGQSPKLRSKISVRTLRKS